MRRLASLATARTAVGAAEAVRAALVVGAHPDGQVVGRQLYVAAAGAVRPDRCHRVTRPWSVPAASMWR